MKHVLRLFWALTCTLTALPALGESPPLESFQEPPSELSLPQALAYTLEHSPQLQPYASDIRAAEARTLQAGLRPNPELGFEIEDLGAGSGGPFSASQSTLSLSQLIELGGKRAKRIDAAERERDVAAWDFEVARADALAETARAFYTVLAAQERLRLSKHLLDLAGQAHGTVQTLVDAGKASAIELSRSQVEMGQLQVASDSAQRGLNAARIELTGRWANNSPIFTTAMGEFPSTFAPPEPASIQEVISDSAYLQRWRAERESRGANIAFARAQAKPDLTLILGARDSRETEKGGSLVLGFSIPLPLSNRNQGTIKEAEVLAEKASQQERAVRAAIENAITANSERALSAHEQTQKLQISVIPAAQDAFDAVQEGYRAGKFGLLDVLLAQRALFDAQVQLSESQAMFLQNLVEIERFTGLPIESPQIETSQPAAPAERAEK